MAESMLSLDEEPVSPDIFSDADPSEFSSIPQLDESLAGSSGLNEPEPTDDTQEWRGVSMDEIYKGLGSFGCNQQPSVSPSENHTILFRLSTDHRGPPKPYPTYSVDKWAVGYVRMPNSSHSLYPIERGENKTRELRVRWEIIQESLLQSFISSAQLEAAILAYNHNYATKWDFSALHHFFSEVIEEEEAQMLCEKLLPKMVQLALQLPTLITGSIPLLKAHTNHSISMSQLQVASLLANAFFCTFPRRNSMNPHSEYAMYPHINFNRLFACYKDDRPQRSTAVAEKLKCLFHYFRRVTTKAPEGVITIQRRYIPKEECPRWDKVRNLLPPLHITSKGTIETEGAGLLQVDFANKYVGGGVLNWGCVQEEIRFVICPELMATMLVTEALDDTEALVVTGVERYSNYEGYSNNFKWTGDFVDETPKDASGRRKTSIVAIDALCFTQADAQFNMKNIIRELNKAYTGFSSPEMNRNDLAAIATGNWGCGAFRGNPKLKVLIQLMAAAAAGRSMAYFTFGDTVLRDSVAEMYWHLLERNVDVARLYSLLRQYETESTSDHWDFYRFLFNRSKIKPLTNYFKVLEKSPAINKSTAKSSKTVHPVKLSHEEEEQRIRDMLEECADEVVNESEAKPVILTTEVKDKMQISTSPINNIIREKSEESKNVRENLQMGVSPLNSLISNTDNSITQNGNNYVLDNCTNYGDPKLQMTVSKLPDKCLNVGKGQKKISEFFSLKTL